MPTRSSQSQDCIESRLNFRWPQELEIRIVNYDEFGIPLVELKYQLQVVILSLGSALFVVVLRFLLLVAPLFSFFSFLPLTFFF